MQNNFLKCFLNTNLPTILSNYNFGKIYNTDKFDCFLVQTQKSSSIFDLMHVWDKNRATFALPESQQQMQDVINC